MTLKFDTLICYAHDCIMLSGKSVIIFNNKRVKDNNEEAVKMALIYGYGQPPVDEAEKRNPLFYLQLERQIYRDIHNFNIGFVSKHRLRRSARTIAANPTYLEHHRFVKLYTELVLEALGKLQMYGRLPVGFSIFDLVEVLIT